MVNEPSTSSGTISADGVVYARPCVFTGVQLTAAAAIATLTLYDNASAASGTVIWSGLVAANDTSQYYHMPDGGVAANNGIYADIGGSGAACVVHFRPL